MMVTIGARGARSSSLSSAVSMTLSTSDSETRIILWPNSSITSSAVSGSIDWFWVAMTSIFISDLITSPTRSAMRLASSCTVMASGTRTSRTTFSRSTGPPISLRFSRS